MKTSSIGKILGAALILSCVPASMSGAHASENCRFGRNDCRAQIWGDLWVETIDLTRPDGRPTEFEKGAVIGRIDQQTNSYFGYTLKRVGFLLAKKSWRTPKIGVFVNSRLVSRQEVKNEGNTTEPFAVEVNDCPLDLYAVVENGKVAAYSVSYYWEYNRNSGGFPGGGYPGGYPPADFPSAGNSNVMIAAQQLIRGGERLRDWIPDAEYGRYVVPVLTPARRFLAKLQACGAYCGREEAAALSEAEYQSDAYLQQLMTIRTTGRIAQEILIGIERIRFYYELGWHE